MQTKVEGLLLSKRPFQENHLLCHLLLRNGRKIVTVFYGGRGGGKKNSPSLLELGYMMDLELAKTKRNSDLYRAKEWMNSWIHHKVRESYRAYLHLCFFVEVIERIAPEEDLWEAQENDAHEFEGIFRVLSNTLFYLEKYLETKGKDFSAIMANFLCKLINQQGFLPSIATCCLSDEPFEANDRILFMQDKGGFAKAAYVNDYVQEAPGSELDGRIVLNVFKQITFEKTSELDLTKPVSHPVLKSLFHYFCFQNQLQPDTFKTYKTIFK